MVLGPEGWTMPVCISEADQAERSATSGRTARARGFYLTGEYLELDATSRLVHVERMHMPDPTPDNHVVTTFVA